MAHTLKNVLADVGISVNFGVGNKTPAIFPKELLSMRKGAFIRDSFALAGLTNNVSVAHGDVIYKEVLKGEVVYA